MTDKELLEGYAGYSDQQLLEFFVQGVPEWQKEQFQRVLRLRRRKIYQDVAGIETQLHSALPARQIETSSKPTESATEPKKLKKDSNTEWGCVVFLAIAAIIIYFIFGSL